MWRFCLAPLLRLEEYGCVLLEGISPNDGHVGINVGINVGITASLGNIAPTDFLCDKVSLAYGDLPCVVAFGKN